MSDLDLSLAYYSGTLGFELTARGVNTGPSQDALDGLDGAQVEIAVLSPPSSNGPHLELLHYLSPRPVKDQQSVWIEESPPPEPSSPAKTYRLAPCATLMATSSPPKSGDSAPVALSAQPDIITLTSSRFSPPA